MDFIQAIFLCYDIIDYKFDSVTIFIEHFFSGFKYYAKYPRKKHIPTNIFRYYIIEEGKKITISVLPSFLLSRKSESPDNFFNMILKYIDRDTSIEKVFYLFDLQHNIQDLKTFRKYVYCLEKQLDFIILSIRTYIIQLDYDCIIPELMPDNISFRSRLRQFFILVDILLKVLHQKGIFTLILENQKYIFINYFLFHHFKIKLLDTS